jgi:hypothetical protein
VAGAAAGAAAGVGARPVVPRLPSLAHLSSGTEVVPSPRTSAVDALRLGDELRVRVMGALQEVRLVGSVSCCWSDRGADP